MYDIKIKDINELKDLHDFVAATDIKIKQSADIVVATDEDYKLNNEIITDLKGREVALLKAEKILIALAKINLPRESAEAARKMRLTLERLGKEYREAKKQWAIDNFVISGTKMIEQSGASQAFKVSLNLNGIALEQLYKKNKNFDEILDNYLAILQNDLNENETETKAKEDIINKYGKHHAIDIDHIMGLPIEAIEPLLQLRVEQEKTRNAEKAEAERLAKAEAERVAKEPAIDVKVDKEPIKVVAEESVKDKYGVIIKFSLIGDEEFARSKTREIINMINDSGAIIGEKKLFKLK